ncbi:MAG TPA: MerR family transcriptional regulator [Burkholderiales bacterium]|nr:MerR family transcriptional regulator [Burkholderiales bacterium]
MNNQGSFTIGALAKESGVGVETVRFYQRKKLLPQPGRPAGGIRRYGMRDLDRLRFVKAAQQLGFSLDEVAVLLRLDDGAHCKEARALAEGKLVSVRSKLAHLHRIESALVAVIQACGVARGRVACPLIASLQAG